MKKLEIIIRPEKVELLKQILVECNAKGAMFTRISGFGNQRSKEYEYKGVKYCENIFQKVKAETVVDELVAEKLIKKILDVIPEGKTGDGKIFVSEISDAVRLRTGECGNAAL